MRGYRFIYYYIYTRLDVYKQLHTSIRYFSFLHFSYCRFRFR